MRFERLSKTIEDHRGLGIKIYGLGAKSQNFSSVAVTPRKKKLGNYFQLGTFFGALETHVLLSFQYMSLTEKSNQVFLPETFNWS